jgi:hypothetical protein
VSCQQRPSWNIEMKTCPSHICSHGLASVKSIHEISGRLWSADRSRLHPILKKNWCVQFQIKLITIFNVFTRSQCHLRAMINDSQSPLKSFHIISSLLKKFQ